MSDLPTQSLIQQMNARQISGEHLEVLGKRASALWSEGRAGSLNEAVVATVKTAGLSPEQVKRVVEFANTSAYLSEFAKEGMAHRVVDFGGSGPANPAVVLQDLNDGGGGSVFDPGNGDYKAPPSTTKHASAWEEAAFEQMFASSGHEYPQENPLGEAIDLRDKLASAYESMTSTLSELESAYYDLEGRLFQGVKQASLSGHSLSEIVDIWHDLAPSDDHVKIAFNAVSKRLVENEVFSSYEALVESLTKHASAGMVNPEHPLVVDFQDFCLVTTKLAEARCAQQEFGEGAARLTAFLKSAAKGEPLFDAAGRHLETAANLARKGTLWAADKAIDVGKHPGAVEFLGDAAHHGTKYVAPLVLANEIYRRTLKHNPTFQAVKNTAVSAMPGTDAYQQKEMELMMRAQGYPMGDGQ